jgi:hypothetical protein
LQLDVRFGGTEVVSDAGTFAYNAPSPWNNGLAAGRVHNGPIINGLEGARRGGRFLWYSWPEAELDRASWREGVAILAARQPGAASRTVVVTGATVEVTDRALAPDASALQVTWLLHPSVRDSSVIEADGMEVVRTTDDDIIGWFSSTYGSRVPTVAIVIHRTGAAVQQGIRSVITRPAPTEPGS